MKGNPEILKVLNELLSDELTAIHQYMVEAEMCENWGYDKLHAAFQKIALDEMHHAEWLIQRLLFLEGHPPIKLGELLIGTTVPDMVNGVITSEGEAVQAYNKAIALAHQVADQGNVDLRYVSSIWRRDISTGRKRSVTRLSTWVWRTT
jgi:bacterioferritin